MSVTLSNALAQYLKSAKKPIEGPGYEAILHFERIVGPERPVDDILPLHVDNYAREATANTSIDPSARLTSVKAFIKYLEKEHRNTQTHSGQDKKPRTLSSYLKMPRTAADAKSNARPRKDEPIEMTQEGLDALAAEIETLKGQRESIVQDIRSARANGDVSENSPLDAAREHQGQTEARIRTLEKTLRLAVVVTPDGAADTKDVRLGAKVSLADSNSGKQLEYILVSATESDPASGKLSIDSPVGKAIVGLRRGQEAAIQTPTGERRYRVVSVEG